MKKLKGYALTATALTLSLLTGCSDAEVATEPEASASAAAESDADGEPEVGREVSEEDLANLEPPSLDGPCELISEITIHEIYGDHIELMYNRAGSRLPDEPAYPGITEDFLCYFGNDEISHEVTVTARRKDGMTGAELDADVARWMSEQYGEQYTGAQESDDHFTEPFDIGTDGELTWMYMDRDFDPTVETSVDVFTEFTHGDWLVMFKTEGEWSKNQLTEHLRDTAQAVIAELDAR